MANSNDRAVTTVLYPVNIQILGHFSDRSSAERSLHVPDTPPAEEDPNAASSVIETLTEFIKKQIRDSRDCTLLHANCCVSGVRDHFVLVLSFFVSDARISSPRISSSSRVERLAAGESGTRSSGR